MKNRGGWEGNERGKNFHHVKESFNSTRSERSRKVHRAMKSQTNRRISVGKRKKLGGGDNLSTLKSGARPGNW